MRGLGMAAEDFAVDPIPDDLGETGTQNNVVKQ